MITLELPLLIILFNSVNVLVFSPAPILLEFSFDVIVFVSSILFSLLSFELVLAPTSSLSVDVGVLESTSLFVVSTSSVHNLLVCDKVSTSVVLVSAAETKPRDKTKTLSNANKTASLSLIKNPSV